MGIIGDSRNWFQKVRKVKPKEVYYSNRSA